MTTSDISVIHVREFLQATAQGEFDLGSSKELLMKIATAAAPPQTLDILIDIREAPAKLSLREITELVTEFGKLKLGGGRKTAVLTEPARFENAHFFSVSARSMGARVQAFTSFEEAFEWLALS